MRLNLTSYLRLQTEKRFVFYGKWLKNVNIYLIRPSIIRGLPTYILLQSFQTRFCYLNECKYFHYNCCRTELLAAYHVAHTNLISFVVRERQRFVFSKSFRFRSEPFLAVEIAINVCEFKTTKVCSFQVSTGDEWERETKDSTRWRGDLFPAKTTIARDATRYDLNNSSLFRSLVVPKSSITVDVMANDRFDRRTFYLFFSSYAIRHHARPNAIAVWWRKNL